MKRKMHGFVGSLTVFITWMVLTSTMLVVPTVLSTNDDDEAQDLASRPGASQTVAGQLANGAPSEAARPVDGQMVQPAAKKQP